MKMSKATAYALHALMYMVRHVTQLPASIRCIAKTEGIPEGQLVRVFTCLVDAGLVKTVKGRPRGYVFGVDPEHISLLDLFEAVEGGPLFDVCLLQHCACTGTTENCFIYAQWHEATRKMKGVFARTSLEDAAWNHPEHRFDNPPASPKSIEIRETNVTQTRAGRESGRLRSQGSCPGPLSDSSKTMPEG